MMRIVHLSPLVVSKRICIKAISAESNNSMTSFEICFSGEYNGNINGISNRFMRLMFVRRDD